MTEAANRGGAPASAWRLQVGECRYQLDRQHVGPVPAAHWGSGSRPAADAGEAGALRGWRCLARPGLAGRRPANAHGGPDR